MHSQQQSAQIREVQQSQALSVAAALLLVENPAWIDDTGFQLSFTAAFAASAAVPAFSDMDNLKDWLLKRKNDGNIRRYQERTSHSLKDRLQNGICSGFRSSFCVSMVTLPLVLSSFYEWNVLSVAVNLAVIPLMSVLLGGCILLAVSGSLILLLGEEWLFLLTPAALPVQAILFLYKTDPKVQLEENTPYTNAMRKLFDLPADQPVPATHLLHFTGLREFVRKPEFRKFTMIYSSGSIARQVMQVLKEAGISVPDDLSYLVYGKAFPGFFNGRTPSAVSIRNNLENAIFDWLDLRFWQKNRNGIFQRRVSPELIPGETVQNLSEKENSK